MPIDLRYQKFHREWFEPNPLIAALRLQDVAEDGIVTYYVSINGLFESALFKSVLLHACRLDNNVPWSMGQATEKAFRAAYGTRQPLELMIAAGDQLNLAIAFHEPNLDIMLATIHTSLAASNLLIIESNLALINLDIALMTDTQAYSTMRLSAIQIGIAQALNIAAVTIAGTLAECQNIIVDLQALRVNRTVATVLQTRIAKELDKLQKFVESPKS